MCWFLVVLSMMMVPQNMTMIPKFHIVRALGGYDKLIGIIMPNFISINVTFFIRQNFLSFPSELEEAAKIDGCSIRVSFLQILLPLSTSILTAMGIMVASVGMERSALADDHHHPRNESDAEHVYCAVQGTVHNGLWLPHGGQCTCRGADDYWFISSSREPL